MADFLKNIVLALTFFLAFLTGCGTTKELTTFEDILYPDGRFFSIRHTDDFITQRFNFYFVEANRLKALGDLGNAAILYMEAIRLDSTCATCYYEISHLLIRNREFSEAENFAFRSVQYDPHNEHFISLLTQLYSHNSKFDKALLSSKYLVELDADNPEYLYQVSQILYEKSRYVEAIEYLNRIEAIIGINEALTFEKHSIYLEAGKKRSALREIKNLISENPYNGNFRVFLGDFYVQQSDIKKATSTYNQVLVDFPDNGLIHFSLANLALLENDIPSFVQHLKNGFFNANLELDIKIQRILPFLMNMDDPDNPLNKEHMDLFLNALIELHPYESMGYVIYGNFLSETGNNSKSIDVLETALLLDERQEEIWHDFLLLIFEDQERKDKTEYSKRAASLYPSNPFFNYIAGFSFLLDDDKISSIYYLGKARDNAENNSMLKAQVLGLLGDLYYQTDNVEKSFLSYQKSISLNPDNIIVLNNYSYFLSLEKRDLHKAEEMISRVILQEPDNYTYLDTYAWVLFQQGKYLDALYYIERAMELGGKDNGVILEHYGDILYKNGMKDEAITYWKKASYTDDEVTEFLSKKIEFESYFE
ncbi:tetratricopeptide repeat protein [Alkalitalea saponilacus]|uniref:Tfp pilus assembly protein PilF n=1 Tax=Alkalitalea saponilacus TaxID=889453 RepID=A0A1T5EAS2_9BACT|nr:hypothetical protein [Alkalitalea saponilacus]ASB49058.1 hypothetical protein CDL62_07860 [Alkalitalea saponilacus]SKB80899.1 Tfp pilus assembly protein PilF [Alkalitalea saponilacus]